MLKGPSKKEKNIKTADADERQSVRGPEQMNFRRVNLTGNELQEKE